VLHIVRGDAGDAVSGREESGLPFSPGIAAAWPLATLNLLTFTLFRKPLANRGSSK